jgi:nucleotide-binding universal stress UspA family protein
MGRYRVGNILVPIDFSAISRHALRHAERIAERTDAQLTLLHAVVPLVETMTANASVVTAAARLIQEMELRGAKELQTLAKESAGRTGLKVRAFTAVGPIAPIVRAKALETRADLIVMGTHGASGFLENLIGSNTYRIATLATIPVLSVHSSLRSGGYRHIVYPLRENAQTMRKFPHALLFARLFKARVHIVGLLHPGRRTPDPQLHMRSRLILQRFGAKGVDATTSFVPGPHLSDAIIRFGRRYPGSLAVISQDDDLRLVELFRGTFPKRILHRALSPVLTVPK